MAKSLRSKWKRKMKAEKRVRYGEKELKRLTDMLAAAEKAKEAAAQEPGTGPIGDATRRGVILVDIPLSKARGREGAPERQVAGESMEVEEAVKRNSKTLRDAFGQYPVWMNKRKVKAMQKTMKRQKKARKSKA